MTEIRPATRDDIDAVAILFDAYRQFVTPDARHQGAASALLRAAADFARTQGALRLTLSTTHDNLTAQALYDHVGWPRDTAFHTTNLPLA